MKIKNAEIKLQADEYFIGANDSRAKDYKIFLDGQQINDVTGIIRMGGKQ